MNIFINYFILLGTVKFNKLKTKRFRLVLGAVFGSLTSILILFPPLPSVLNFFVKFIIAVIIMLISFGFRSKLTLIKNVLVFYLVTFLFLGSMIAIWFIFTPLGMLINNGVVYFNIPPLIIIFSAFLSYIIVWIINKFITINLPKKVFCKLSLYNSGNCCNLCAKIDTGNALKEPFSLCPVIVVDENAIYSILSDDIKNYLNNLNKTNDNSNIFLNNKNIRVVPFTTVNSTGLMPAFKPDKIFIDNKICNKDIYIAISTENNLTDDYKAIIGVECFN